VKSRRSEGKGGYWARASDERGVSKRNSAMEGTVKGKCRSYQLVRDYSKILNSMNRSTKESPKETLSRVKSTERGENLAKSVQTAIKKKKGQRNDYRVECEENRKVEENLRCLSLRRSFTFESTSKERP